MLCQNCQKRIANVHLTQIVNNKKTEVYLCEQCAAEKGHIGFISPMNIGNFLSGFMGEDAGPRIAAVPESLVCGQCGMSYAQFQKTGKLGCGNCYEVFEDRLKPVLRRLHGSFEHSGKIPAKLSETIGGSKELERLKDMLNKAVQKEEYERAAEIRDKIKAIESSQ